MSWSNNALAFGEGLSKGIAGQPSKFWVNPKGQRVDGITFAVEGPSNPLFEYSYLPNGIVEVKYTPAFQGIYRIHIKNHGAHIVGSPFTIVVETTRYMAINSLSPQGIIRQPSRWENPHLSPSRNIKLSGAALTQGKPLVTNQFLLDARNAGIINAVSGLSASMEGPGRVEVGFKENLDGTIHVQYKPFSSGVYKMNLRYGENHLAGSPLIINVV